MAVSERVAREGEVWDKDVRECGGEACSWCAVGLIDVAGVVLLVVTVYWGDLSCRETDKLLSGVVESAKWVTVG